METQNGVVEEVSWEIAETDVTHWLFVFQNVILTSRQEFSPQTALYILLYSALLLSLSQTSFCPVSEVEDDSMHSTRITINARPVH